MRRAFSASEDDSDTESVKQQRRRLREERILRQQQTLTDKQLHAHPPQAQLYGYHEVAVVSEEEEEIQANKLIDEKDDLKRINKGSTSKNNKNNNHNANPSSSSSSPPSPSSSSSYTRWDLSMVNDEALPMRTVQPLSGLSPRNPACVEAPRLETRLPRAHPSTSMFFTEPQRPGLPPQLEAAKAYDDQRVGMEESDHDHEDGIESPSLLSSSSPDKSFYNYCTQYGLSVGIVLVLYLSLLAFLRTVTIAKLPSHEVHLYEETNIAGPEECWNRPGYWTNQAFLGTQWRFFSDDCVLEPLVDVFIGTECGGTSNGDPASLAFLSGQSILFVGDSIDRYLVRFLCGYECPKDTRGCPEPCRYPINKTFSHYTYPFLVDQNVVEKLSGISVCHFPTLQFTLVHAMTYGVIDDSNALVKNFPYLTNYAFQWLIKEQLQPLLSGLGLASPALIVAQSALWDTWSNYVMPVEGWRNGGKTRWHTNMKQVLMPTIEEVFPNSPFLFLRTIPPAVDQDNDLMNQMSMIIRHLVQDNHNHRWHLLDMAWMLNEAQLFVWDGHHYGPFTLYQVLNVLLNQYKQLHTRRSQMFQAH